jgi:hypothetical protein
MDLLQHVALQQAGKLSAVSFVCLIPTCNQDDSNIYYFLSFLSRNGGGECQESAGKSVKIA